MLQHFLSFFVLCSMKLSLIEIKNKSKILIFVLLAMIFADQTNIDDFFIKINHTEYELKDVTPSQKKSTDDVASYKSTKIGIAKSNLVDLDSPAVKFNYQTQVIKRFTGIIQNIPTCDTTFYFEDLYLLNQTLLI